MAVIYRQATCKHTCGGLAHTQMVKVGLGHLLSGTHLTAILLNEAQALSSACLAPIGSLVMHDALAEHCGNKAAKTCANSVVQ